MTDLVSIVMPAYNCEKYVGASIESIINQTYQNWELLVVDDCSTDKTQSVVHTYLDARIKYTKNEKNSGAAVSRNKALKMAKGRWIAFLDSDDMWMPEKLNYQIQFMQQNGYSFSCTKRTTCHEDGSLTGIYISSPPKVTKFHMHNYCWIGASTAMYDQEVIGLIQIADLKKRNDYAIWLKAIEKADCYYLDETLSIYRKRLGSISNVSKVSLIKHFYILYRQGENMSPVHAGVRTFRNLVFGSMKKALYYKRK